MGSGAGTQDGAGAALVATGAPDADPVPGGRSHRELAELPVPRLRARRRALLVELDGVVHWQRLVRARRDLAVARAVGPADLRVPLEAATDGGPLDVHAAADLLAHDLTEPGAGLRELVLPGAPPGGREGDLVADLHLLAAAQRRLAGYERALRAELAAATTVLVERCGEPVAGA